MKKVYMIKTIEGFSKYFSSRKKALDFLTEYTAYDHTAVFENGRDMKAFVPDDKFETASGPMADMDKTYRMGDAIVVMIQTIEVK